MVKFERASGILLHISSLPGPNGIGDIGNEAYKFVDFLHESNQKIWQVRNQTISLIFDSRFHNVDSAIDC